MSRSIQRVSSIVAGPLGVSHLPRLYLDASIRALHSEESCIGSGTDRVVCLKLGLDPNEVEVFIRGRPTFEQFEEWVANTALNLDDENVRRLNEGIIFEDFRNPQPSGVNAVSEFQAWSRAIGGF